MTLTIVITDAEQRAALAVVRTLGRAGHRIHVCASATGSLAAASRFAASDTIVPSALSRPEDFATAIEDVVRTVGADILLPISEAALLALLPIRDRFGCLLPFTTAQHFEDVCNKEAVLATAARLGIRVPAQRIVASKDRLDVVRDMSFPIVLKPARSISGKSQARLKTQVLHARDAEQLQQALESLPDAAFPVLCQERIEGPGVATSILMWDGDVKAAFAHQRLREKPPSGGVSVLRESIPLDHALLARSVALLREFEWSGVAMVEYKVDRRSGEPFLMEINGRFWGSLQLAIDAGVDFPRLLVDCATGNAVNPVLEYPPGVRTRWEWGEVDHLLARMLRSPEALSLPAGAPSRLGAVAAFLGSFKPSIHSEVFARDDMRPFLRESVNWFRGK